MSGSLNRVAWQRWTDAGYSRAPSLGHLQDDDRPGYTLCGKRIPTAGDGVTVENSYDLNTYDCQRCSLNAGKRNGYFD